MSAAQQHAGSTARTVNVAGGHASLRAASHRTLATESEAKTVNDARASLGMGVRSGDLSALTPIAELRPEDQPTAFGDRLRGLRHKLPGLFGRKK